MNVGHYLGRMDVVTSKDLIKRFAAEAALTGRLPCSLYGTVKQLQAFAEALHATREFDRLLNESAMTMTVASEALAVKRAAAARFKLAFDVAWPA